MAMARDRRRSTVFFDIWLQAASADDDLEIAAPYHHQNTYVVACAADTIQLSFLRSRVCVPTNAPKILYHLAFILWSESRQRGLWLGWSIGGLGFVPARVSYQ